MSDERVVRRAQRARRRRSGRPIPAVLGVLGVLGGVLWWSTGPAVDVAAGPVSESAPTTPLLSARRIPEWVGAAAGERALRSALEDELAGMPASSCVVVRAGGTGVIDVRGGTAVIPASNLKPLTASAAVDLLGPDTRLVTSVVTGSDAAGVPPGTSGRLVGDLVLVGGGDPVLSTAGYEPYEGIPANLLTPLELLADRVAATGINVVTGSVVADESRFDDVRDAPGWKESYVTDGQVAPLSALVVDDARPADPSVPPALAAARSLTRLLEERGITIQGAPRVGVAPSGATEVARVESPTVAELAEELVRYSDNTTAELLVKEIGRRRVDVGSTAAGLEEVRGWAAAEGVDLGGAVLADGSGLSRDNRLSCTTMVEVLERAGPDAPLASWLARPGQPGSLDDRLVAGDLTDRVRAKTGSLNGVRSLAGWLTTTPGVELTFAIASNTDAVSESELEAIEERILAAALSYPDRPARDQLGPLPPRSP